MKLLNWIKNLFKKKESPRAEAPSKPNLPEIPNSPNSSTTSNSSKKLNIAIVRGHGGKDSGALGCGTSQSPDEVSTDREGDLLEILKAF